MFIGLKLLLIWARLFFHQPTIRADATHPRRRRHSARYRAKKKVVRGIWIATSILMLAYPLVPFIVTLGLFTTFLSFTILDETPD